MENNIIIDTFRLGDETTLSKIAIRCLREINSRDLTLEEVEKIANLYTVDMIKTYAKDIESLLFVARQSGSVVGMVMVTANRIRSFFVDPDKHQQGIGKMLLEHAEVYIQKNRYTFSFLFSSVYALEFYKKHGYREVGNALDPKIGTMMEMRKFF